MQELTMRHIIAIFILVFVFILSGCSSVTENIPEGEGADIGNQEIVSNDKMNDGVGSDVTTAGSQDKEIVDHPDKKTLLIGTWHEMPSVGNLLAPRYHFYDDGSYLYEVTNYYSEARILNESGAWSFANNTLTLITKNKTTLEGGEKSTEPVLPPVGPDEYAIVNCTVKTISVNPPETESIELGEAFIDKESSNGYWAMDFNGITYWRLSDDPGDYHDNPYKDGEIWNPWPQDGWDPWAGS